jgi:hypothetical protein
MYRWFSHNVVKYTSLLAVLKPHDHDSPSNKHLGYGVMVFNATVNTILVISGRSILLVEETGIPRENH